MTKIRISDNEFWTILRENVGLYSRTARAIAKTYNMPYSRQAVQSRAEKKPELLKDIQEENLDIAEEGLHSLMRSKNERIRFKSIELYLRTRGRGRGYVEKIENDMSGNVTLSKPLSAEDRRKIEDELNNQY